MPKYGPIRQYVCFIIIFLSGALVQLYAQPQVKYSYIHYFNLGNEYTMDQDYIHAIPYFDSALAINPTFPDAYYNRGLSRFYLGRFSEANGDFTAAIKYNPKLVQAYYWRARSFSELGLYGPAAEDITSALNFAFRGYDLYVVRAQAYYHLGQYAKAVQDYSEAIFFRHEQVSTFAARATALAANGQFREAIADANIVLDSFSHHPGMLEIKLQSEMALQDTAGARKTIREMKKLPSVAAGAWLAEGVLLYGEGQYTGAITSLRQSLKLNEDNAVAIYMLGIALYSNGQKEEACRHLLKAEKMGYADAIPARKQICR